MAKKDKEFGEWKGTCLISGKLSIKRFEKGFIIKERGSDITDRIHYPLGTKTEDMTDIINDYYNNLKTKQEKK